MKDVEKVLQELMELHPEYKKELKCALRAYNSPLSAFQKREAEWRLADYYDVDKEVDSFDDMVYEILNDFENGECFLNYDAITQIVENVLVKHAWLIREKEDVSVMLEKQKNPIIYIWDSRMDIVVRELMEMKDCDSMIVYDAVIHQIKESNKDYLSWRELSQLLAEKMMYVEEKKKAVKNILDIAKVNHFSWKTLQEETKNLEISGKCKNKELTGYESNELMQAAKILKNS